MRTLSESTKMLDPKVVLTPKLIKNKMKWDKNKNEHTGFIVVRRRNAYVHLSFTIFNDLVANTMKYSLDFSHNSLTITQLSKKQIMKVDLDFSGVLEFGSWRWLNSQSVRKKILFFASRRGIYRWEFAQNPIRIGATCHASHQPRVRMNFYVDNASE